MRNSSVSSSPAPHCSTGTVLHHTTGWGYMPVSPLAVATMLATSRLGAIHNVVFAGFSAEALAARVRDAGARVIVTADEAVSFFLLLHFIF